MKSSYATRWNEMIKEYEEKKVICRQMERGRVVLELPKHLSKRIPLYFYANIKLSGITERPKLKQRNPGELR